ncbi:MAG: hypothetical protein ACQEVT_18065 [Pseudomonadota bacterium]|uniref:hypothetical protein n=1 Tax=Roseovarius TaxID=74030 RepID=UPI0022A8B03F|nr:hypothetical protein [Roseovarius sp. EGI FJ00037]MCZ0812100.1 hypothetical protein [Roseovarius sp. EGI FJ00037]
MSRKLAYESEVLQTIHEKANTEKNECFFVGFLEGVLANNRIDETELEPLLAECEAICRQVRDADALEIIAEASAGHHDTSRELLDLLAQIAEIRSQSIDPACTRSSANRLLGFCAGVNCDSIITGAEARVLNDRINAGHDLDDDPRVASLRRVLLDALEDDIIDPTESSEISELITSLVGDSYADTGIASSETLPVIQDLDQITEEMIADSMIVLTGAFAFGTRSEVSEVLESYGAIVQRTPTRETDVVVIGTVGSAHYTHKHHGGKLAKALKMRADGPAPRIYLEAQLRAFLSR